MPNIDFSKTSQLKCYHTVIKRKNQEAYRSQTSFFSSLSSPTPTQKITGQNQVSLVVSQYKTSHVSSSKV